MICPFLSYGKPDVVECRKDCALYNGSLDGSEMECIIFSIGAVSGSAVGWLKSIEKDVDEIAAGINRIELSLPDN